MLNFLLDSNYNFTIDKTIQERFKFYFVDTPDVIRQYFEKEYNLHSKVMEETFSLDDINNKNLKTFLFATKT